MFRIRFLPGCCNFLKVFDWFVWFDSAVHYCISDGFFGYNIMCIAAVHCLPFRVNLWGYLRPQCNCLACFFFFCCCCFWKNIIFLLQFVLLLSPAEIGHQFLLRFFFFFFCQTNRLSVYLSLCTKLLAFIYTLRKRMVFWWQWLRKNLRQ